MCAVCNSKMGFKRVMLNRLQIGNENRTLIAGMDDGNRKNTDFSIEKILSDSNSNNLTSPNLNSNSVPSSDLSSSRLYQQISNEYYAYWNRRIYPPVSAITHLQQRSAFSPLMPSSSSSSASAQYEIMNLSLRMYDQQINLNNTVDRIRNTYSWSTQPIPPPAEVFDPNKLILSNNNNIENNLRDDNNTMRCATNNFAIYQNLKSYGIDLTSLSVSNVASAAIKTEPININSDIISATSNLACSVCNKVFENALILDAHERTHKSPRYKCEECGKQFSQLRNFKYHISVSLILRFFYHTK